MPSGRKNMKNGKEGMEKVKNVKNVKGDGHGENGKHDGYLCTVPKQN
jgi:hypothetical protein